MSNLIGGRYQIEKSDYNVIGVGGMGTVYRGTDTLTNQTIALKQLRPEISHDQPEMIARFAREAQALALLNHPHIVKVLDTVEDDPYSYIIMEYVSGGSLRDLLDKKEQLPIKQVLEIALDLSDALIRAHRLKILHRDIKPGNVLLAQDGTPRLTDFGVAHLGDEPGVTRTGAVVGTLNYLSPEALNGFELDERSDIWAFGAMLYEMLAGHLPFEANTMTSLITMILTKTPPPLQMYRDDIPIGLELLVEKMLEKDRDERIDSMRQVGAELERIMRDEPTSLESTRSIVVTGLDFDPNTTDAYKTGQINRPGESRTNQTPTESYHPGRTAFNIATTPAIRRSSPWAYVIGGILGIFVLIVAIALSGSFATPDTPPTTATTLAPHEYAIVVANLQQIGAGQADASRAIISNLREAFEQKALYSSVRIITPDTIVTTDQEALALAQTYNAPLVVWGSADADSIDITLSLGALTRYPAMPFDRDTLERNINLRLTLTDADTTSLAPYVASALALLAGSDGDVFEWARLMAVVADTQPATAEFARETFAVNLYRYALTYKTDPDQALSHINNAISQNSNSPLLYWLRAMLLNRQYIQQIITSDGDRSAMQQRFDEAQRNQESARRLALPNWVAPYYSLFTVNVGGTLRTVIELANTPADLASVIEQRPDLWGALYLASETSRQAGDNDQALALMNQALALQPNASLPYTSAILFHLRAGNLTEMGTLVDALVTRLPNTATASRMFDALFGVAIPEGALPTVFNNLLIGQYDQALATANQFLTSSASEGLFGNSSNMLLFASIAQCNLQEFERARFGLNTIVSNEPDFMFARLVRADVNNRNANAERATTDLERIMNSPQADSLAPFVEAVRAGTYRCSNFFDLTTITSISEQFVRQDD